MYNRNAYRMTVLFQLPPQRAVRDLRAHFGGLEMNGSGRATRQLSETNMHMPAFDGLVRPMKLGVRFLHKGAPQILAAAAARKHGKHLAILVHEAGKAVINGHRLPLTIHMEADDVDARFRLVLRHEQVMHELLP